MAKISVSEEQVLFFRAVRGHLAGTGAASVSEAARSIIGAQSQQLSPSLLAISMRTAGRPKAADVKSALFEDSRTLVRTWGQRDTIHVYDAATHWRHVVSANQLWSPGGRGGPLPSDAALDKARVAIADAGGIATRGDLLKVAPRAYVKAVGERAALADLDAQRFAAGRLLWRLAQTGQLSVAEKSGREQSYALRSLWFADLPWPQVEPEHAAVELIRDYLRVYGPATPHDVAHFFGAKVTDVRNWLNRIEHDVTEITCGDRTELMVMSDDVRRLRKKPPTSADDWPVRLMPLWESMLMGHTDKSWTVPIEAERKQIWKKAAMVSAVVLDRGRVVATWTQKATSKRLRIEVQPLSAWRKTRHWKGVKREAEAIAAHMELADVQVEMA